MSKSIVEKVKDTLGFFSEILVDFETKDKRIAEQQEEIASYKKRLLEYQRQLADYRRQLSDSQRQLLIYQRQESMEGDTED
jgi:light-regulated signal transduction histidine kinase (bacteriophytochrome)